MTGKPVKPIEHSNEYGIVLSGPLVPFGSWRHKVFFFGNYNGFRYSSADADTHDFSDRCPAGRRLSGRRQTGGIYDPLSQTACTANSTNGPCRYHYGYGPGTGTGPAGNPVAWPRFPGQRDPCQRVLHSRKEYAGFLSTGINKLTTACRITTSPPTPPALSIGP